MSLDFEMWEWQQGIYDLLVLGLTSVESRFDYIFELQKQGIDDRFIAKVADAALVLGIDADEAAGLHLQNMVEYSAELRSLGVSSAYDLAVMDFGLLHNLDPQEAADMAFRVEEDYQFALREIEHYKQRSIQLQEKIRDTLIEDAITSYVPVAEYLFDLVDSF